MVELLVAEGAGQTMLLRSHQVAARDATHCICETLYYRVDGDCIPCPDSIGCDKPGQLLLKELS